MAGADSGDGDPLDICVLSERPIDRAEVLLDARVIGGIPMLDDGEADDKIIAVLRNDDVWGHVKEIDDIPVALTQRLLHYFSTYKLIPGRESNVRVAEITAASMRRRSSMRPWTITRIVFPLRRRMLDAC